MADPTVPWGIPLFDDNTPFAPIQAPFNTQSEALNDALSDGAFAPYATKALMDAAPGTRVGQHASVYADTDTAKNGDYRWIGSEWNQILGDTGWLSPALGSGWTNESGGPVQYHRKNGVISMRGRASGSLEAGVAFRLPPGFLPDIKSGAPFLTICDATSGIVRVQISSAGDIFPVNSGAFNTLSFAALRFDAI